MSEFNAIRPSSWDKYIGQGMAKEILKKEIAYATNRNVPLRHILLTGQSGLGKTTLCNIIAQESNRHMETITGNDVKNFDEVMKVFESSKLLFSKNPILFIDEIHLLKEQEIFYTAMTDNFMTINSKHTYINPQTREKLIRMPIPPFTLIGATTHSGLLLEAFRNRFQLRLELEVYTDEELCKITNNTANKMGIKISQEAVMLIAKHSQTRARRANDLLLSAERIKQGESITVDDIKMLFRYERIFPNGLTGKQITAMKTLYKMKNRKLGVHTIASAIGTEVSSWREELEPFLIYKGYVMVGTGGRILTDEGCKYLSKAGMV